MAQLLGFLPLLLTLAANAATMAWPAAAFTPFRIGRPAARIGAVATFVSSSSSRGASDGSEEYPSTTGALASIDFRAFLTQRTIQSFMFLLSQTRDMYTVRWLDNFTQPVIPEVGSTKLDFEDNSSVTVDPFVVKPGSRLLTYHGLDALNATLFPTWESYFEKLLDRPAEVLEISSGNPGTPFRSFDVEIDPPRLCSRMIAVRSQIALEWTDDLVFLANMTAGKVFSSYWKNVKNNKTLGFDREGLWFLEYINSEQSDYSPNPLRKGSFDLLKLLATQESVQRVLSYRSPLLDSDESEKKDKDDTDDQTANKIVSKEFLREFYSEHLDSHFQGYLKYGKADDFIEELMLCPPRLVTSSNKEITGLVDPLRLAEAVMQERSRVAMEWKELAAHSLNEHFKIQKMQLDKMNQRPADEKGVVEPVRHGRDDVDDNYAITDNSDSSWQ